MKTFVEFKKILGLGSNELEKMTGYSRQWINISFGQIQEGKSPAKKFIVCMDSILSQRIEEETRQFNERMRELQELQEELNNIREG